MQTQELLARAQAGSPSARNEVYSRYRAILLVEIRSRSRISLAHAEEAEDVLHTAFVSVLKELHKLAYLGPGKFRQWLKRVVVNEAINQLRREDGSPRGLSIERDSNIPPIPDRSRHGPSEEVSLSETTERLLDRLRELPEEDHDLIVLKVIEKLSFARIAEVLGIPATTVYRRYSAIVKRLRTRPIPATKTSHAPGSPSSSSGTCRHARAAPRRTPTTCTNAPDPWPGNCAVASRNTRT